MDIVHGTFPCSHSRHNGATEYFCIIKCLNVNPLHDTNQNNRPEIKLFYPDKSVKNLPYSSLAGQGTRLLF